MCFIEYEEPMKKRPALYATTTNHEPPGVSSIGSGARNELV